jgi:hypothetical protein
MPQTLVLEGPRRLRLSMNESRPLQPGEVRLRSRLRRDLGLNPAIRQLIDAAVDRRLAGQLLHPLCAGQSFAGGAG